MPTEAPENILPGDFISEQMKVRGWTQKDLGFVLGINPQAVSTMVTGIRGISAEMARSLGTVFNVPPEYILGLQKKAETTRELRRAKAPKPDVERKARLASTYPIREMIKRGWLNDDFATIESQLEKFFGATSLDEVPQLTHAAKKTDYSEVSGIQLVWLFRVKQIASEMMVARYSPKMVRAAVQKLSSFLYSAEEARNVPRVLSDAGIRFVIVESLPGARIDGVCLWLDDMSPVIGMSLRFDRLDNFWFVLRHELEHVLQMHGKSDLMFDADLEGEKAGSGPSIPEEDRIANTAASEFCVPSVQLEQFVRRKQPFFAERDIVGFSRAIRVHPAIVAGQLQHRTKRYDRFRQLLVKVRSIVSPNAIVDGWGDVVPVES